MLFLTKPLFPALGESGFFICSHAECLKAAGIRAIKTVAQSAAAMIGTGAVLQEVDWQIVISAAVLSGILSLLTSAAGLPELSTAQNETEGEE